MAFPPPDRNHTPYQGCNNRQMDRKATLIAFLLSLIIPPTLHSTRPDATETVVSWIYMASDKWQILLPNTDSAPPAKIGNTACRWWVKTFRSIELHAAFQWNVIFPGVNFALEIFPNNCAAKLVGCFSIFLSICASSSLHPCSATSRQQRQSCACGLLPTVFGSLREACTQNECR